ncbi:hypothetical protein V6N11_034933 [Hibiscus sabdariffa]|uniref:Disease resistance protein At4g27190-like leucine-rich repeats domain-containing protein n=1 Tax=Hibiscus sabdariffa TaxID=183260 RepID=A0ABR1ZB01_9ROSI
MQFSSIPSSICLLTSLNTLCLDQCKLGDNITIIGGLRSLEILSLLKSDIRILPEEIGQLVRLKLLDVSRSAKLKTISPGVLSSLSRLEELYMGGTCIQWGQSSTASLAELNTLPRLSILQIQIPNAMIAPQDLFRELQKLESYKIFIGEGWEWERFGNHPCSRTLKLRLSTSVDDLDSGIKKLLKKTEDLHLEELKGVKIALQVLTDEESLSHLKNLHIQNGRDTEYIVNGENEFPHLQSLALQTLPQLISFCPQPNTGVTSSLPQHELPLFGGKISFPCLEKLWLKSINVTRVWSNQLSTASFRSYEKLTTLEIEGCGSLKHLFSFSMAKCLVHLTVFKIIGCKCLREVIYMEEIEEETQATLTLFHQLKSIKLKDLQHLIGFCFDSQTQVIEFPAMKSMTIDNCPELEGFICTSSMEGNQQVLFDNKVAFPSLEQMRISYLRKLKMIWHNPLPPNSFLKLREIRILRLPNLNYIWKNDSNGIFSFKNLRQLFVYECWSLKNVFPVSVARDLPQLSDLRIINCGVEEIISKVEDSETSFTFEFHQLTSLVIWNLPECKCFYPGSDYIATIHGGLFSSSLFREIKAFRVEGDSVVPFDFQISFLEGFDTLEELCIANCEVKELFCTEGDTDSDNKGMYAGTLSTVRKIELRYLRNLNEHLWKQDVQLGHILPNLETLVVYNCANLISLGSSSTSFQNLTTLEVGGCGDMKYLDTSLAVQGLSQLKKLIIKECISMKEIVASEEDETTCQVNFSRLKSMELVNLPRLKSFCWGNHRFGFPCLEEVIVRGCPELEIFCKGGLNAPLLQSVEYGQGKGHWSGDLDSTVQHLHSTKVWCQGMGYLVLSELSKSIGIWKEKSLDFKKLTVLEVDKCNSLKYIFSVSMALDLVQLEHIRVKNCPKMEYIIKKGAEETEMDTVWLPRLQTIILESCSELRSFCMGSITLQCPSLYEIGVEDCREMYAMACTREEGGGEKTPFINDKVLCVSLRFLFVKGCHNFEYVFPSSLIKSVVRLSYLDIIDCKNIEEVIFTDESAAEEVILFTKLERLQLIRLPKLRTFRYGDNSETGAAPPLFNQKVVFPRLTHLTIQGIGKCGKIWHGEAAMNSFYELTHLRVEDCEGLLNILPLYMVERLEKLQEVFIRGWFLLQASYYGMAIFKRTGSERMQQGRDIGWGVYQLPRNARTEPTPVLGHSGHIPQFTRIILEPEWQYEGDMAWTTTNQYFFNLTSLELTSVTIPNGFIQSLPNLEKLYVGRVALNGLFPSKGLGDEDEPAGTLVNLKELRLSELSLREVFCNLEILQASGCKKLMNLVPSSVSFKHLTTLQVSKCHGFRNLVTFTTAKSMMQLKRMTITDCEMLEEIIASTTDEVADGIIFSQLKSLKLVSLPTLSRFCPGKYTLVFPSLEEVIIRWCPRIKLFTKGKLSTPMLHGLQSTKDEYVGRWEGDLNVTLQQLFVEKGIPSLEDLELSSINIQLVWKHKLQATHPYAQNLTCLTIEGCHNLNCLFSPSMLESFVHLKKLKVENCGDVENVFFVKGLTKEEMMNQKTFRVLEFLLLKDLPKLTRFCHGNYFELPLLTCLSIENCPTLKTFISDAEGNKPEIASPPLFDEKAVQVEEFQPKDTYYWKAIIEGKAGM